MKNSSQKNKPSSFDSIDIEDSEYQKRFDLDANTKNMRNEVQKPSNMIIIILFCLVIVLALQFGNMQHKMDILSKELKHEQSKENRLSSKVNNMDKELKQVEKEEKVLATKEKNAEAKQRDLEKREDALDRKEHDMEGELHNNGRHHESWGETPGEHHHIKMEPLLPHVSGSVVKRDVPDIFKGLMGLHELMKKNIDSFAKPGAVKKDSSKKKDDKKHEDKSKKHEEKKEEKKEEEHKKPIKIGWKWKECIIL